MAKTTAPVEHVADLTCGNGHTVEVHWTEGQQADHWQCSECLPQLHLEETAKVAAENDGATPDQMRAALRVAGGRAHERSLVKFGNRKKGDRQLPHDLAARQLPVGGP